MNILFRAEKSYLTEPVPYYLVLGADDRLTPDSIHLFKQHAKESNADIVTAWILREGRLDKGILKYPWLYAMHAYVINHAVSSLIRKSLHNKFGLYSNRFKIMSDMLFIKKACRNGAAKIHKAPFLAGEFGCCGVSSTDKAASYCEYFRVQYETEDNTLLQVLLFSLKLIWNARYLVKLARRNQ